MSENLDQFRSTVRKYKEDVIKKRKSNELWNVALSASAIVFTLLATVTGTLSEGKLLNENFQKVLAGIFGAVSVAAQAAANKFPLNERAKGYRKIEMKLHGLYLRLKVNEPKNNDDELSNLVEQYEKIIKAEEQIP